MAARRCPDCEVNFPVTMARCPCCNSPTQLEQTGRVDDHWQGHRCDIVERGEEVAKVEAWRLHELLAAGYSVEHAELLARNRDVDLHQAVDLVRGRGCKPELAFAILA
jgi:hypothetical protein